MVPQCYVDGDVADWQSDEEDPVGCDVAGVVVYLPSIGRKTFEKSCDWLEERAEERCRVMLEMARQGKGRLGVIDAALVSQADEAISRDYGNNHLEEFLNDTHSVAVGHIGAAYAALGPVCVKPLVAGDAVSVIAAKSFKNEKGLSAYLQDGRGAWRPSVRLTFTASLDGSLRDVENGCRVLRAGLAECGPITEWRVSTRVARVATTKPEGLRLVVG